MRPLCVYRNLIQSEIDICDQFALPLGRLMPSFLSLWYSITVSTLVLGNIQATILSSKQNIAGIIVSQLRNDRLPLRTKMIYTQQIYNLKSFYVHLLLLEIVFVGNHL